MQHAAAALPDPTTSPWQRAWTGVLLGLGITPRFSFGETPAEVTLGQTFTTSFEVRPRALRALSVELWLEGQEKTIYRRGTETVSDHCLFFRHLVLKREGCSIKIADHARVTVPENAMPTLNLPHNQIEWHLRLSVRTTTQAEFSDTYCLKVSPKTNSLSA